MKSALIVLSFFTFVTGIIYPVLMTGIAQVFFRDAANGSLLIENEKIIGSSLIAQNFKLEKYFWSRPSASDFNILPSGATNLSVTSKALSEKVRELSQGVSKIPQDLISFSASGLDPHLSPEGIYYQLDRVIKARALTHYQAKDLNELIEKHIKTKTLGFMGNDRINVLELNLALDQTFKSESK